jgi:hypothetical protein
VVLAHFRYADGRTVDRTIKEGREQLLLRVLFKRVQVSPDGPEAWYQEGSTGPASAHSPEP